MRVLDDQRQGHPLSLVAALEWVIKHDIRLVNISLGTTGQEHIRALHAQCKAAIQAGILIVAATRADGWTSYPSHFPETISVGRDDRYQDYEYGFNPGNNAEFLASGLDASSFAKEASSGLIVTHSYSTQGTSIAAARMTANCQPPEDRPTDELSSRKCKRRRGALVVDSRLKLSV